MHNFKNIIAWQKARALVKEVYLLLKKFPKSELHGLVSQIMRSVISIPSNIAEGNSRDSTREYLHHLSIAVGSLAELETQLIIASRLGYCAAEETDSLLTRTKEIGRMISGLQRALKRKL